MYDEPELHPLSGYHIQREALENRLKNIQPDTFRTLADMATDLGFPDESALIQYVTNKRVLDIGSGFNGLAVCCILRGVPTDIASVSLRKSDPNFAAIAKRLLNKEPSYSAYDQTVKEAAIQASLLNTYPLFAHDLSPLPDNSFDVVIDNAAVFNYAREEEALVLRQSLREELRVLRDEGTIRIGDFHHTTNLRVPRWKEQLLMDTGFDYRVISLPATSGFEVFKRRI